ncbi:MAG TPA: FAD/NAD(P)-binding protein [Micromonosporaceae bacterium]|nr:FAD/NAD(P)-binding protein [Micromonosporaceae bacterium]
MGPRGISVLERLAARVSMVRPSSPILVYAIDAVEVGAGRVWRTDQPPWFTMNTVVSEVTMYSGESDGGPARPGAGPSLGEWIETSREPDERLGPNDYASRLLYGQYLRSVFDTAVRYMRRYVEVVQVTANVEQLEQRDDGGYRLVFDRPGPAGARVLWVDKVVLTTGHQRVAPDKVEHQFLDFADRHRDLRYLVGDSAADMPLDEIAPGETIGIRGLGLSFYDVMLSLTIGRGGRFVPEGDRVKYLPSGREPHIVAGSRSGLPIPARGKNQKGPDDYHRPMFLTRQAIAQARRHVAAEHRGRLNFAKDVLPLILLEVEHVFLRAHIRASQGNDMATEFAREHASLIPDDVEAREKLLKRFGLTDVQVPDLNRLARPFKGQSFAGTDAFQRRLLEMLQDDLTEAEKGNVDGPLKAALDVLRDVRNSIRDAVDFGGLLPDSLRDDFLNGYVPVNSLLSAGPPMARIQQLIALMEVGLFTVVGPDTRIDCDEDRGRFVLYSPQVAGSVKEVTALVDARIPKTDLKRDLSSLMQQMIRDGLVSEYIIQDPVTGKKLPTGGLAVTPSPFRVIDPAGRIHTNLYALGLPTEHTRWFTQVGSSRTGSSTLFYRDADAIAAELLRPPPTLTVHDGRGVASAFRAVALPSG